MRKECFGKYFNTSIIQCKECSLDERNQCEIFNMTLDRLEEQIKIIKGVN